MWSGKQRALVLLLASLLCLEAGCRRNQPVQEDPGIDASTRTHIEKAAEQIHEDLMGLTAQSNQKRASPSVEAPVMGPLAQPVTLKWAGPALPAIENVARMIGYTVDVRGSRARPMPVVSIDVTEKRAISVLEDIGWQAGPDFGLVVKEEQRMLYIFLGD